MKNGVKLKKAKKPTREATQVKPGSDNVFADLAVPHPDEYQSKAALVQRIAVAIAERELSQARAGVILGIDQPKISTLLRGQFGGFSFERLLRFLNALGRDIEIVIHSSESPHRPAQTRVVDA